MFSHGSGALKSFRVSLPQTLVMYSPGKGSGKFQESASGNMEAGMAGQATGSCQGQQGTGSGSNTLDPWTDYLQRQPFVQQTLNQVGGPRIPSPSTNGSRGGSSSPNPHQSGFWNQGLVTQPGVGLQQMPPGLGNSMDDIVAARGIFQQMNPRELQVVFQEIDQRLNFQRHGLNQICQRSCDLKVMRLCLLGGNLEEMRNGTSSVVVKSGFLVRPKVITIAGEPGKMKYWG